MMLGQEAAAAVDFRRLDGLPTMGAIIRCSTSDVARRRRCVLPGVGPLRQGGYVNDATTTGVAADRPGVLELIRSRLEGESDDYVLSLTLEGGGMRGVVSGAMLIALRDLGITRVFDAMYGTSSGSINL